MKKTMNRKHSRLYVFNLIICLLLFSSIQSTYGQMTFVHPGGVNGKIELDYVKQQIAAGAQPWTNNFNTLRTIATATTNTTAPTTENGQKDDARKAYANALAWYYTGNVTYANNAIGILNMWANTFNGYTPLTGQNQLVGGWIGALLAPAAEIMRGYNGFTAANITNVQNMFKTKFYPVINTMSTWNGNVDLTQIDAIMNIAVFCEDETEFNLGVQRLRTRNPSYFYLASDGGVPAIAGDGGNVNTFWSNPTAWPDGLTQETCRDNNHHSQFAMASALRAAEVAWNQGVDLYTENTARYTKALELMAIQSNTGNMQNTCANNAASPDIYATWEIGYNHYHNRKNISLPNTLAILTNKVRPSGASDWNIFYETLTHNMDGYSPCPVPKLGNDASICGVSSLILDSKLTTASKVFKWYKDNNLIAGQTSNKYTITTAGTYKVTVDSVGCSISDEIIITNTILVNLGADKELCNPVSYTLNAGNATIPNVTYLWNTGANTRTIVASKAGTYSVTVSAPGCTAGNASNVVTTKLLNVKSDTLCMAGTAQLSVVGTGTYAWFDVANGGTALATGNTYNPAIISNKTYYVEETSGFSTSVGKLNKGTGQVWAIGTAEYSDADKMYQVTVAQALNLKSVAIYNNTANGSVTINFTQNGNTVHTKTFTNLAVGKQTLLLNFNLAAGNYIVNGVGTTATIDYESSGAAFPYTATNYLSFTYNQSWQSAWYGFLYDWQISTASPCLRTPAYAIIDNNNSKCKTTDVMVANGLNEINLYPNPSNNYFTIDTKGKNLEIYVYDFSGRLVENFTSSDNINIGQNYNAGIYNIRFKYNDQWNQIKIIKQ